MRKYRRLTARYKMTQKGLRKLNKKYTPTDNTKKHKTSFFAEHWKEYI
jgi:hypothetical protein